MSEGKRVRYRDYIIDSCPWKSRGKKEWSPKVNVEYHYGSGVKVTPLEWGRSFKTEKEAIEYGIKAAHMWIDKECY